MLTPNSFLRMPSYFGISKNRGYQPKQQARLGLRRMSSPAIDPAKELFGWRSLTLSLPIFYLGSSLKFCCFHCIFKRTNRCRFQKERRNRKENSGGLTLESLLCLYFPTIPKARATKVRKEDTRPPFGISQLALHEKQHLSQIRPFGSFTPNEVNFGSSLQQRGKRRQPP